MCAESLQFGIINDHIVEDEQSFAMIFSSTLPETLTVGNVNTFEVSILDDNDCRFKLTIFSSTYNIIIMLHVRVRKQ